MDGKPLHSYLTARERLGSRYRVLRWGDRRRGRPLPAMSIA
jgi:hypothetical protein